MAKLTAQQSVNTRDLPELVNVISGAQAANNNPGGWYFSGIPAEIGFQYRGADNAYSTNDDIFIHFFSTQGGTGDIGLAAQIVFQGTISSLTVKMGSDALYSISDHTPFDITALYTDANDNGKLDSIPAQIFSGVDELNGSQFADVLFGFDSADVIRGNEGDDEMNGGQNDDNLTGGLGADEQTGGVGADTFFFVALSDSTKNVSGRDTLLDFSTAEGDKIDLEAIDARKGDGNAASKFKFIGKKAFDEVEAKNKGELRYKVKNGDALLQADVNGDNKADFAMLLNDVTKLKHTDFFL